jgi:hypothetical protein
MYGSASAPWYGRRGIVSTEGRASACATATMIASVTAGSVAVSAVISTDSPARTAM